MSEIATTKTLAKGERPITIPKAKVRSGRKLTGKKARIQRRRRK